MHLNLFKSGNWTKFMLNMSIVFTCQRKNEQHNCVYKDWLN